MTILLSYFIYFNKDNALVITVLNTVLNVPLLTFQTAYREGANPLRIFYNKQVLWNLIRYS